MAASLVKFHCEQSGHNLLLSVPFNGHLLETIDKASLNLSAGDVLLSLDSSFLKAAAANGHYVPEMGDVTLKLTNVDDGSYDVVFSFRDTTLARNTYTSVPINSKKLASNYRPAKIENTQETSFLKRLFGS